MQDAAAPLTGRAAAVATCSGSGVGSCWRCRCCLCHIWKPDCACDSQAWLRRAALMDCGAAPGAGLCLFAKRGAVR